MYDVLTIEDWIRRVYAAQFGQAIAQNLWLEPYGYPLIFTAFNGVSGASTLPLGINSNADFVLLRINYAAGIGTAQNAGNKVIAQVRANIVDSGSARPFYAGAVMLESLASNHFPARFTPYPRFLSANTTLSVTLTGAATAAETYTYIELMFEGINVRQYSGGMASSLLANVPR